MLKKTYPKALVLLLPHGLLDESCTTRPSPADCENNRVKQLEALNTSYGEDPIIKKCKRGTRESRGRKKRRGEKEEEEEKKPKTKTQSRPYLENNRFPRRTAATASERHYCCTHCHCHLGGDESCVFLVEEEVEDSLGRHWKVPDEDEAPCEEDRDTWLAAGAGGAVLPLMERFPFPV